MSRHQRSTLATMLRRPRPTPPPSSLEQERAAFRATMADMIVPPGIRTAETTLGSRRALLVEPAAGPGRPGTILYFHGGSFVVGSPETSLALTAHLVLRTGVRALSLDYRLAPEHPFPAAIEDAVAAYAELSRAGAAPIVFAGDSAGGTLTVTACLAARDAGRPMPAAIVAFSPAFDATRSGASMDTKAGIDPYFTRESLAPNGARYRGTADPAHPLLSPVLHADLTGLPPMLLQVGTDEVLLDDSTRMAARARDAEVDVVLDVTAGVPHVFPIHAGRLDEADEALERAALFLTQRLRAAGRRAG
jgi:epsilon-lactone hydrolase